jgi:hypothetical protein
MATGHLRHYLDRYLAPHPSRQVKALFHSAAIFDAATAAIMVFEPVYLISIGYSLRDVLVFFAAVYAAYFFLLPLGGKICRSRGFAQAMLLSSPFLILYYLSLFATAYNPAFLTVAGAALVVQKILYWPAYHANFATYSDGTEQGRELSTRVVLAQLAAVVGPLIGGIVIAKLGFQSLFWLVALLIIASNIPLLRASEIVVPRAFSYREAIETFFRKENRKSLIGYMGFGEEEIALIVWPVFIAITVGSALTIGVVVSAAMLVSLLAVFYVGRVTDDGQRDGSLRRGAVLTALSWFARPLVSNGIGAFVFDGFYRIARNIVGIPLVAIVYDGGRRSASVMESVVFFEMSLALGKFVAAVAGAVIATALPNPWTALFVMAGAFSLLYALVAPRRAIIPPR